MCQKHDGQRYYSPDVDEKLLHLHIPIKVEMHIQDADRGCQDPKITHPHMIEFDFTPIMHELEVDDQINVEAWMQERLPLVRNLLRGRTLRWHNTATHRYEFFVSVDNDHAFAF